MFKKIVTLFITFTLSLYALNEGDSIPENVQKQLQMQNDKVYIINFFASWCKSCKKELPLISQVYHDTSHNIIAISAHKDEYEAKAKKFVKNLKLPFRVIYDTEQKIINSFEPKGFPALYYVKNGKILKSIIGAIDNIDVHIKQHIKELK